MLGEFNFLRLGIYLLLFSIFIKVFYAGPFLAYSCSLFNISCPSLDQIPIDTDFVDEKFIDVKNEFLSNFVTGHDIGSSLSVYYKGKRVIDLAAGHKDLEKTLPYKQRNLQMVYSTSKLMSSLVIAMLVDRGLIAYEDKITKIWPEYGQGGKENETIADLIQHKSGVSYFTNGEQLTYEDLKDYEKISKILESQPHIYSGEKKLNYHILTLGHYINEIVRRADPGKRVLHSFIQEEICNPLGIDFKFILTEEEFETSYTPIFQYPLSLMIFKVFPKVAFWTPIMNVLDFVFGPGTFTSGLMEYFDFRKFLLGHYLRAVSIYDTNYMLYHANSFKTHTLEFPSFNGKSNAYSLAKLAALIANNGELDGVRLFKKETIDEMNKLLDSDYDHLLLYSMVKTHGGMTLFSSETFYGMKGNATCIGGGGLGGSFISWNQEKNIGFSYVMNAMGEAGLPMDTRSLSLYSKVYTIIENLEKEEAKKK